MKVTIEQASVDQVKNMLGEFRDKYKPVMVKSINKTLKTAQTQAVARIGNELNLKAARIKQDFSQKKANYSDISGAVIAKGDPVGLVNFGAKQTLKGVTVKVLKSSPRELLKHAFIAHGKGSTKKHVFWRAEYGGVRKPAMAKKQGYFASLPPRHFKKIPLHRLTGPRIEDIFAKSRVFDPVSIQAQHVYLKNVKTEVDSIIRRYGG